MYVFIVILTYLLGFITITLHLLTYDTWGPFASDLLALKWYCKLRLLRTTYDVLN